MEQFVLGIFQEQLSKFLVGFKKEQVNANLLNGKGEIRDVDLNCSFVNDMLCKVTPHVMLESIKVSKLGFHVTNWTNLKKAPILVNVEDVFVTVIEPLTYTQEKDRLHLQQLSFAEYKELIKDQKPRGSYNLFDRILDNLQIEIRSIQIVFQPRGRFKTHREGPWTPPRLLMTLRHVKYGSVDEFGNENVSPEDCWKHNKFHGHPRNQTLLVYKKASMQVTMAFQKFGDADDALPPLMRNAPVDVYLTFHKAFINGSILSLQMDTIMNRVEVNLDSEAIPVLAHAVAGMQYCFTKDQAFEDPLRESGGGTLDGGDVAATNQSFEVVVTDTLVPGDESGGETDEDEAATAMSDDGIDALINGEESVGSGEDGGDVNSFDEDDSKSQGSAPKLSAASTAPAKRKSKQHPVIVLPSGFAILRKISMALSIRDCKVRGNYSRGGGYIQLHTKGLVAEMIWPKVTREKGCYAQMSLAYVNIQENFKNKVTIMLRGGSHRDTSSGPIEAAAKGTPQIPRDETFPLFEDRCIHPDPLDLRHSFPAQALGVKATISFVDKVSNLAQEEIMIETELGVDMFEIIVESESWCRAIRLGTNEKGGGFDPRWNSGDWTNVLTTDMMHHPSQPLVLSDHLQGSQVMFLDENDFLSSDLFNVTARISNINVKLPAAVQRDIRSCDVVLDLQEVMVIVSSALPRTFLTGKIGSAVQGDNDIPPEIDFPNDPSDICYALQEAEDPLIRQQGTETSRRVSTFRAQLTTRGLSVRILPIIPFCDAEAPKELLAPLEMTMIFCFEGEPPDTPDSDLIKIVVFQSLQIHNLDVNCDFDMITGAVSSIIYHTEVFSKTVDSVKVLPGIQAAPPVDKPVVPASDDSDARILSTIGGRKVLVKRQFERSRSSGGLSCELSVQIANVGLHVWRQNAPLNSRFRASITGDHTEIDESPIPLVKLLSLTVTGIEVGMEAAIQQDQRRLILKACISQLRVQACDFDEASKQHVQVVKDQQEARVRELNGIPVEIENVIIDAQVAPDMTMKASTKAHYAMVSLVTIGGEPEKDIMVRLEETREEQTAVSVAIDMDVGGVVSLHVHEIEIFFLLLVEALLLPTDIKLPSATVNGGAKVQFPEGSIGALFASLIPPSKPAKIDMPPSAPRVDVKKVAAESSSLDQLMHSVVLNFLPDTTGECLVRFTLGNLMIFIPHHSAIDGTNSEPTPWLGHELREASILSAYLGLTSDDSRAGLVQRLGKKGSTWSSFFNDDQSGFHHSIKTSQGLHSAEVEGTLVVLKNALIDSFDIGVTYNPQGIDLMIGDSTLSVQDLDNIRRLRSSIISFVHRIGLTRHRIESVTSALARKRAGKEEVFEIKETRFNEYIGDGSGIVDDAELSLQQGRAVLEKLKVLLEMHDADMKSKIKAKQEEVDRLRVQVFLKERSRVAALALMSCQAAGWLRVGGTHMTGERSPTTASMWRQHAVLRKSLLIMYAEPGKPRPLDVISLQGAKLLSLAGGRRKSDIKNGFAIRENSGCIHYLLTPNGRDLEVWIRALQRAIKSYSEEGDLIDDDDALQSGDESNIEGAPSVTMRNRARTMSSESEVKRMRAMSSDTEDFGEHQRQGGGQKPRRSSQIRKRLSKVTASTKSSIGSAVQAAKERRQRGDDKSTNEGESATSDDHVEGYDMTAAHSADLESNASSGVQSTGVARASTGPEPILEAFDGRSVPLDITTNNSMSEEYDSAAFSNQTEASTSVSSDTGPTPRFGGLRSNAKNRFGSAMQGAKEKALAVAEELRRRKEERDLAEGAGETEKAGRKGFGLRGRLENVAANVKNKTDKAAVVSTQEGAEKATAASPGPIVVQDSEWSVQPDNSATAGTATTGPSNIGSEETHQTVSGEEMHHSEHESVEDTGEEEEADQKVGGIRNRLTKIGAAVKIARQEKQNAKATTATGQGEQEKSSLFSIRRKSQAGNQLPEESDLIKLKKIRAGGGFLSIDNESNEDQAPPLARIKGSWIVSVQSQTEPSIREATPDQILHQHISNGEGGSEESLDGQIPKSVSQNELPLVPEDSTIVPDIKNVEATKQREESLCYSVRIISQDPEKAKIKVATVNRDFMGVIGLFIDVLESVSSVPEPEASKAAEENRDAGAEMSESLASSLGVAPMDIIKLTGELLGGLLSGSSSFHSIAAYHEYQCEVLTEFLNSCLTCPMPVDGCMAVLEFLEIDAGVMPVLGGSAPEDTRPNTLQDDIAEEAMSNDRASEIMSLTSACLTHLLRAEASGILVQQLGAPKEKKVVEVLTQPSPIRKTESMPVSNPYLEPLLPSTVSSGLRDAMHEALRSVMTERDEAQSQLISSSIQHLHEMESERKQVELAKKKLFVAEDQARRQQGLFAERFKDPKVRATEDLQRYLEEMVKSSDMEIEALCRQLAKEVSEKTESRLEIVRLKESMKLERETDAAEKRALEEALRKARKQLSETKSMMLEAAQLAPNR